MFKNLFKRKDEFLLFLERLQLQAFYEMLDFYDKEKFKKSCYGNFEIMSRNSTNTKQLAVYREKDDAVFGISNSLNYNKEFDLSLKFLDWGKKYVVKRDDIAQLHIAYALNYQKLKQVNKCIYHCEEAVKLDHDAPYAYERLIIDYVKIKDFDNALRICNMVLKSRKIHVKKLHDYAERRKQFILKQIEKTKS